MHATDPTAAPPATFIATAPGAVTTMPTPPLAAPRAVPTASPRAAPAPTQCAMHPVSRGAVTYRVTASATCSAALLRLRVKLSQKKRNVPASRPSVQRPLLAS